MKCVAVVGATGAVGQEFGRVLSERGFPADEYRLLASLWSAGRTIQWGGQPGRVEGLTERALEGVDLAFFSAGAAVSREYAPLVRQAGGLVIDNSSAFRMDADVPLVVPEVNAEAARRHTGLIANPNCSTIIMAVVLWPLHRFNRVRRVVVSTYQAVSGAGGRALQELERQTRAVLGGEAFEPQVFPVVCAFNVFSHNSAIGRDGYNVEERKMIDETQRIFGDAELRIAPTCIRVPVMRAHAESLAIEFSEPMDEWEVRNILETAPGVRVVDDRLGSRFPTPLAATGRDEVLVGRIRQDLSVADGRGIQLFVAGDQLRKGAALNAVQIAEGVLGLGGRGQAGC